MAIVHIEAFVTFDFDHLNDFISSSVVVTLTSAWVLTSYV